MPFVVQLPMRASCLHAATFQPGEIPSREGSLEGFTDQPLKFIIGGDLASAGLFDYQDGHAITQGIGERTVLAVKPFAVLWTGLQRPQTLGTDEQIALDRFHVCFFSLPEHNCLCLCTSAETATEGNKQLFSVSSRRSHQPSSIPLTAQTGKRRKKGKRSRSARIPDMVRCGVASVFLSCIHKTPPHYPASHRRMLTSVHTGFYHRVRR